MKRKRSLLTMLCFVCLNGCDAQTESQTNSLKQVETIPLQNISGRIDHLSFDDKSNFVFVAALGNNTVEVADLANKKIIHSIKGLHEPQGIVFIPENNSIIVANDNGECYVFSVGTFQKTNTIQLG